MYANVSVGGTLQEPQASRGWTRETNWGTYVCGIMSGLRNKAYTSPQIKGLLPPPKCLKNHLKVLPRLQRGRIGARQINYDVCNPGTDIRCAPDSIIASEFREWLLLRNFVDRLRPRPLKLAKYGVLSAGLLHKLLGEYLKHKRRRSIKITAGTARTG